MNKKQIQQIRSLLKKAKQEVKSLSPAAICYPLYKEKLVIKTLDQILALLPCRTHKTCKTRQICETCNGTRKIPDDFDDCGGVAGACVEIMHMNGELMKPCPDCS